MKDVVSQEGDEQKALDGLSVMLENMIGMPVVGQLVETIILDVPTLVAEPDHPRGGTLGRGQRSRPDPVAGLGSILVIDLPAHGVAFQERTTRTGASTCGHESKSG